MNQENDDIIGQIKKMLFENIDDDKLTTMIALRISQVCAADNIFDDLVQETYNRKKTHLVINGILQSAHECEKQYKEAGLLT